MVYFLVHVVFISSHFCHNSLFFGCPRSTVLLVVCASLLLVVVLMVIGDGYYSVTVEIEYEQLNAHVLCFGFVCCQYTGYMCCLVIL